MAQKQKGKESLLRAVKLSIAGVVFMLAIIFFASAKATEAAGLYFSPASGETS